MSSNIQKTDSANTLSTNASPNSTGSDVSFFAIRRQKPPRPPFPYANMEPPKRNIAQGGAV